jgi:UrcA family protein
MTSSRQGNDDMMTRTLILAVSLTLGVPAFATPAADGSTVTIHMNDLNLTSAQDRQTLDARVKRAALRLCRSKLRGTAELASQSQCVAASLAKAQPQADRAIAQAHGGVQLAAVSIRAGR